MRQPSACSPGSEQSGKLRLPAMRAPSSRGAASNVHRYNHRLIGTLAPARVMRPSMQAPTTCSWRPPTLAPRLPPRARKLRNSPRSRVSGSGLHGRRSPTFAMAPVAAARSTIVSAGHSGSKCCSVRVTCGAGSRAVDGALTVTVAPIHA
jgi:hypothetical protein